MNIEQQWDTALAVFGVGRMGSFSSYQSKEYGEPDDKQVSGRVEVNKLEVGQSHRGDHPEHDTENAAHNGTGDGEEK